MARDIEFHEAANIFPLDDEHLDELAKDIKANGQQVLIQLLDGKILDGRRRWLACRKACVSPKTEVVKTDDPVSYVLSLNLHRRHLSPSQSAMVAGRARKIFDEQALKRKSEGGSHGAKSGHGQHVANLPDAEKGRSRDKAAAAVGVGGRTVDYASKVLKTGTPELVAAVDADKIAVSTAARLASEAPEVQNETLVSARGRPSARTIEHEAPPENGKTGKGVTLANEAINCLKRIPKNDHLRKRGFQIVTDWIRLNK
jgi:hypothetical protein